MVCWWSAGAPLVVVWAPRESGPHADLSGDNLTSPDEATRNTITRRRGHPNHRPAALRSCLGWPRSLLQVVTWVGGVSVAWVGIAVAVGRVGGVASVVVLGAGGGGEHGEQGDDGQDLLDLVVV